jgi:hypothetical protein
MIVHGRDYLQIEGAKAREPQDLARTRASFNAGFHPAAAATIERRDQFRAAAAINTDTES